MSKTVLVIFVRNPVPGRVKTRLARDIGDFRACELYQAMVSDIIESAREAGFPVFLFHDGEDGQDLPATWRGNAGRVVRQQGSDLGERMAATFEQLFSEGFEQVVLTGSDIPGIDAGLIQEAVDALAGRDVAVAPSCDGGYSLIAIRSSGYRRELFQDMAWSTPQVLQATIDRCSEAGLSCRLLDCRQDIDTMDDLRQYAASRWEQAVHTNAWLDMNIALITFPG